MRATATATWASSGAEDGGDAIGTLAVRRRTKPVPVVVTLVAGILLVAVLADAHGVAVLAGLVVGAGLGLARYPRAAAASEPGRSPASGP